MSSKGKGPARRRGAASAQERGQFLERMKERDAREDERLRELWSEMKTDCEKGPEYDEMIKKTLKARNAVSLWLNDYKQQEREVARKQNEIKKKLREETEKTFHEEFIRRLREAKLYGRGVFNIVGNVRSAEKALKEETERLEELMELRRQARGACEKSTILFDEEGKGLFRWSKEVSKEDQQLLALNTNPPRIDTSDLSPTELIKAIENMAAEGWAKVFSGTIKFGEIADQQRAKGSSKEFMNAYPDVLPYLKAINERNERIVKRMAELFTTSEYDYEESDDYKYGKVNRVVYTKLVGKDWLFDKDWTEEWIYLKYDYPSILQVNQEAFDRLVGEGGRTALLDEFLKFLKGVRMVAYANDVFSTPLNITAKDFKEVNELTDLIRRITIEPPWFRGELGYMEKEEKEDYY